MKKINFPLVVIMLVAFAAANFAGKNPSKEAPIAIVMKIVKDVNFKKGEEGAWAAIKIGQALATGDEIKTGAKSLALIKFTDNSILRVRENCTIKIYADKNNKQVSKNTYISKGDVNFEVTKQQNEEFQFTTPTMVASIRGTKGLIGVEDDGSSSLLVEEGSVDFMSTVGDQKKGNVRGGNFAQVDKEGQVDEGAISADLQKKLESSKKTNTKKIIIQTNQGNLIIEYLEE